MLYPWEPELPALAELDDQAAANAINAMTLTVIVPIPSSELLAWSGQAGRFARVDAATQSQNPDLKSLASAAKLLLTRDGTSLDLVLPDRAAMVDAMVAAGVLTPEDKTSLYILATVTRSKYTPKIGPHHVAHARSQQ